jgi:hypothetical protein
MALLTHEADDLFFVFARNDLDKSAPAYGPDDLGDVLDDIGQILAIPFSRIVDQDDRIGPAWQVLNLSQNGVFVQDMYQDSGHNSPIEQYG